jgi:N-acyl-D-aspartate/D-glutamate deacylase
VKKSRTRQACIARGLSESISRESSKPEERILFYGDWSQVEQDGVPVPALARKAGKDPLDYVFDLPLDTQLVAKLFQNDDSGGRAVAAASGGRDRALDAGAHLIYFCDRGFGLHFLGHWVRERRAIHARRRACAA